MGGPAVARNSVGIARHFLVGPEIAGFIRCHAEHVARVILEDHFSAFERPPGGPILVDRAPNGEHVVAGIAVRRMADAAVFSGIVQAVSRPVVLANRVTCRRGL